MTQREAVNDAWDLPKAATMDAFVERHPQWAAYMPSSKFQAESA
jgi:ABC-2 type transport system permease protein